MYNPSPWKGPPFLLGVRQRSLSIEAEPRVPRLLHQRLERRIGAPPELQEAGVVLDGLLSLAPALIDLGQPEMGRAGVEEIVGQSPVPGQSVLMTSKLV